MYQLKSLIALTCIITCFIQAQGADKYTDENRPYEFGFSIDGEQHRHEKKDKNGIIMGEFGFITADGVYHVTVYATDEQGRFKILSMKNIRVKPYPTWHPNNSARQGHSLSFPPSGGAPASQPATLQPPATSQPPPDQFKPVSIEPPANSCSHCSLPKTTTRAPQLAKPSYNQQSSNSPSAVAPRVGNTQYRQGEKSPFSVPGQPNSINSRSGFSQNYPTSQLAGGNSPQTPFQQDSGTPQIAAYPQQVSKSAQNYPLEPNSLSSPQFFSQQGPAMQPGSNPAQSYKQQVSGPAQNYPAGQQNSPQTSTQQGSVPQKSVNSAQSYPQQGSGPAQTLPPGQQNIQNGLQTSQQGPGASQTPQQGFEGLRNYNGQKVTVPQPPQTSYPKQGGGEVNDGFGSQYPVQKENSQSQRPPSGERTPKQLNAISNEPFALQGGQAPSNKPILFAAQMQIVDKNTDIYHKGPGEQEGLPEGINKHDISHLLYTFNYTLGFQGHFEEGYSNGVKQGYYFVTGRNGVRTRVDYVADEKGFRPKITQDVLDLLSDDVPKPETEKEEKYGLKGYEFKWLYYPVETKTR